MGTAVKNLAEVTQNEQKKFIESFDTILFDMDGVLWIHYNPIPGAVECVKNLKQLGKKIGYATNNGFSTIKRLTNILNERQFEASESDVVNPLQTVISLLKRLKIKDSIYVVGTEVVKNAIRENGFTVIPDPPSVIEENVAALLALNDEETKVGAVISDVDFNVNYAKLNKALWYLNNNPDCIYIVTIRDKSVPIGPKGPIIGMYHFVQCINELSGREYIEAGKPSKVMVQHIKETFNITNPNKVLFVGDSIQSDLGTAAEGNFQKLLVLSGTDKMENILNWHYPESYKPDYYIEDLGVLNEILKNIYFNNK